jgi:two-component system sensor histidine kinase VanS
MRFTLRPRMTIRARLTLTYALLLTIAGATMLAIVYIFMRFVPIYAIASASTSDKAPEAVASPSAVVPGGQTAHVSAPASGMLSIRLTSETDILNTLLLVSVAVLIVLAIAGAVIGWIVAGRVLRPLKAINHAAQLASTGSLDHRVGLTGPHDEVRDLSDTFDEMLTQLDRSFQASQRFAANASHELRTPLATTKTMLEVALADPELDLTELRRVTVRVYETNRRNMQTVEALLDLSEIGSGTPRRDRIDLDRVAVEALTDLGAEVKRRGIVVTTAFNPSTTTGDSVLLRQAVRNLLQNAVIHNVDGGIVEVSTGVGPDGDGVQLMVVNSGPAVPAEIIDSLTEPFVRGAGRTTSANNPRGHGLGLAITASVAAAELGRLDIEANQGGGLRATFWLPSKNPA